ncbi:response regulator [Silvibacterium acidisoli]|uniref:response regulator n=1 Tax=Acidobacteriaceae bacterium ZG23-2 TaxID=2883246 RepID=UPI00406D2196
MSIPGLSQWNSPEKLPAAKRPVLLLCIDDEKLGLEIRKTVLERAGYRVITALDGNSGLDLFRTQPIDGVVLDFFMPGMDGGQVAAEMRRSRPEIPILLLTAYINLPQEVVKMAEFTLLKGEGPEELLSKIRLMLEKHREDRR